MSVRADGVVATRDRIVRAAIDLFFEFPYEDVTLTGIARAAGVSHQTVLNHFESKEGVFEAAAATIAEETLAVRHTARAGDIRHAVHVLVGEYERFGDANFRWAATAERLGRVAHLLGNARDRHQEWLAEVFAQELPTRSAERRRLIPALHAATAVYTWKLLRRDLDLSRADTEAAMVELVAGALARASRR